MLIKPSPSLLVGGAPSLTYRGSCLINNPGNPSLVYNVNGVATTATSESIASMGEEAKDRTIIAIGYTTNASFNLLHIAWCGQQLPVWYTALGSGVGVFVASGTVPRGVRGPLALKLSGGFFNGCYIAVFVATGLLEDKPLATASQLQGAATVGTVDLITKAGGFVVAIAANNVTAAQNCTWSGDQTPTEIIEFTGGPRTSYASLSNTNDDAANTITSTWDVVSTTTNAIVAASFR